MADDNPKTPTSRLRRPPLATVATWVSQAWRSLPDNIMVASLTIAFLSRVLMMAVLAKLLPRLDRFKMAPDNIREAANWGKDSLLRWSTLGFQLYPAVATVAQTYLSIPATQVYPLEEITRILEEDDEDVSAIYIESPEATIYSDEDSADEDSGGLIGNLSSRQLRAGAETVLADGRGIGGCDSDGDEAEFEQEGIEPVDISSGVGSTSTDANYASNSKWKICDPVKSSAIFPDPNLTAYRDLSPVELFEFFFDKSVIDLLVEQTRSYALFLNMPDPEVTKEEMKCFLGLLALSSYNCLPGKKCYWDSGTDMRNEMVHNAMRRNRFVQIMRFLHCADNTSLTLSNMLAKLRPLMKLLKAKFLQHFQPMRQLIYDESIIEYYGRHGYKHFIRRKPIRFKYKVWYLNGKNGYLANFEVYQGKQKDTATSTQYEKYFGKAAAPLLEMVDEFPVKVRHRPFYLYFDNLFTSLHLLKHLKDKNYESTGTVRQNRVPKECPIARPDSIKRKSRGYEEHALSDEGIIIVRWMDNSVVTIASTVHDVEPMSSADRYSRAQKRIKVPHPNAVTQYNSFMGGTDQIDANVGAFRIAIHGKKWWWPIFTWLCDIAICNGWALIRSTGANITQLEFRRQIAQSYLTRWNNKPKGPGRRRTSTLGNSAIGGPRYDQTAHFVGNVPNGKRRRCAGDSCNSMVRTQCTKCDVGMCIPCFIPYHHK
ncbi:hypothetical protein HPB49_005429 [Dermacentor silvarum]|uniref:Uncharacterized protein n=1 Tax=Dermacentor silvarum TaxID=543639 RepID=A0ACB8D3G9_DERSI|nr:hypothetical protein HPB49_005429 [Dermacentor silvarum]